MLLAVDGEGEGGAALEAADGGLGVRAHAAEDADLVVGGWGGLCCRWLACVWRFALRARMGFLSS